MSEVIQTGGGSGGAGSPTQGVTTSAYTLLASEQTVQVLSPTVVNDVLYCTISTWRSNVIASYPIPQGDFESENAEPVLTTFAQAIEEVMALPNVVAGVGSQVLDASGLLSDNVVFTVQYVQPGTTGTNVTAEAVVPVSLLTQSLSGPSQPNIAAAKAIIDATYADLQKIAGG